MSKNSIYPPWWFVVVLVVMVLPMAFYPRLFAVVMMESLEGVNLGILRFLVYTMPVYVIASQIFSYKIYAQWPALAWVLQLLLFLVYIVSWWLVVHVATPGLMLY